MTDGLLDLFSMSSADVINEIGDPLPHKRSSYQSTVIVYGLSPIPVAEVYRIMQDAVNVNTCHLVITRHPAPYGCVFKLHCEADLATEIEKRMRQLRKEYLPVAGARCSRG